MAKRDILLSVLLVEGCIRWRQVLSRVSAHNAPISSLKTDQDAILCLIPEARSVIFYADIRLIPLRLVFTIGNAHFYVGLSAADHSHAAFVRSIRPAFGCIEEWQPTQWPSPTMIIFSNWGLLVIGYHIPGIDGSTVVAYDSAARLQQ